MSVPRLTATERKVFAQRGVVVVAGGRSRTYTYREPALGTLDERLNIIIKRHGGTVGPIRLTPGERADYAAWLAENGEPEAQGGPA